MSRAFTKERDDEPDEVVFVRARRKGADTPTPPADHGIVGFGATVVVEGVGPRPGRSPSPTPTRPTSPLGGSGSTRRWPKR